MLREKGECKNAKVHKYPDGKYYLVYTNLPLPRTDFLIKIPKNFTPSDYIETIIEGVII